MDVLLHITTPDAAKIAAPLAHALHEHGATWGCFLTNDGVKALSDANFMLESKHAMRIAVCDHSWVLHMGESKCPVELGSQTINSAMMQDATKVISL